MKKRKEESYNEPWERDFYETGSTRPPKSHGGLIAVLLVMVILLGGICSTLGIINIKLLQQLAMMQEKPDSVTLFGDATATPERVDNAVSGEPEAEKGIPALGARGQTVSDFDRRFYQMPRGVLVTEVTADLGADQAGIRTGDVIVALEGSPVTDQEDLAAALEDCEAGETVTVEFYRQSTGEKMSANITLSEE